MLNKKLKSMKGDSNKKRLKLICRDILNDNISREMLKAFANAYINITAKTKGQTLNALKDSALIKTD